MKKKIKFEMPDRRGDSHDTPESVDGEEPGVVIDFKSQDDDQPSLFRSRWNELQASRQPKPIWRSAAGVRLVLLVVVLGGVIWAMMKAGQPESWNWLFDLDKANQINPAGAKNDADPSSANIVLVDEDSTNQSEASNNSADSDGDAINENGNGEFNEQNEPPLKFNTEGSSERVEIDFWKSFLRSLSGKQQVRLFWLLDSVVNQKELAKGQTSALNPILKKLVSRRQQFHKSLIESGNDRPQLRTNWKDKFLPALRDALLDEKRIEESIRDEFLQTIGLVRKAADSLIEDKTPIERPKEAYSWFAAWSDVFEAPLDQANGTNVTVTQLLAQPTAYRGDWISISGTVMRMSEVATKFNPLGIERYYVMWIKPDHPSSFPYCVYSLMAPEIMMESLEAKQTELEIPVMATARFYKNRIFASDQPAFAPVLMTANVRAIPPQDSGNADSKFIWPSTSNVVLWLGIIGGFAVLVAWSVFRSTLGSAARSLPKSDFLTERFHELEEDQRVETTREKLLRLSEASLPDETSSDSEGDQGE